MTTSKRWIVAGVVLVSAATAAGARTSTKDADRAHETKPSLAKEAAPAHHVEEAPPVVAVAAPAPPMEHAAVLGLRDVLAWSDDAARIDAITSAAASGAIETLPLLESVELKRDPEGAPAIIHAVAVLGAQAPRADAARAAETLGAWLRAESGREGADARANVSLLVDALGEVGGHEAALALATALDGHDLPLHVETLAVQNLSSLGDPRARAAVERFASRVAALPEAQGLDEELRHEAIATAAATVDRLSL